MRNMLRKRTVEDIELPGVRDEQISNLAEVFAGILDELRYTALRADDVLRRTKLVTEQYAKKPEMSKKLAACGRVSLPVRPRRLDPGAP